METTLTGRSSDGFLGRDVRERLLFLAPAGIYLVILTVFPFVYSVYLSLHRVKLTALQRKRFAWFENYSDLFSNDIFLDALRNTAVLTVSSITIEIVLGFLAAKVFFSLRATKFGAFMRSMSIIPMMITPICIGLIFAYIFNPTLGVANFLLEQASIEPLGWFSDPDVALTTMILVNSWQWTPFMMLLMMAGLTSIDQEQYEAAEVDGAKWYHIAAWIEIPAIRGIVIVGVILRIIDNLRLFDIVYVTTRGGPSSATEVVTFFAYKQDFQYFQIGYGSAAAVVILIISIVISTFAIRYLRSVENE